MENEEQVRPVWQVPEIIDLDIDETTKDVNPVEFTSAAGPS